MSRALKAQADIQVRGAPRRLTVWTKCTKKRFLVKLARCSGLFA